MAVTSLEFAKTAAIADQKKAEDILVPDPTGPATFCDYFVICTGGNARLADAVADAVRERQPGIWVQFLLRVATVSIDDPADYGSVVDHAFQPGVLGPYYRLERFS